MNKKLKNTEEVRKKVFKLFKLIVRFIYKSFERENRINKIRMGCEESNSGKIKKFFFTEAYLFTHFTLPNSY